jgi:flagellar motility protein MotE (MotC chaperone)
MKKLLTLIAWTLALNFLAAVAGVVFLYNSGKLNHDKVQQIKDLVFAPATQPAETKPESSDRDATTQPTLRLESMLAKVSGRSASEQVEFIQNTFNAQMAILDRRFQDLQNQRRTVDQAKAQADKDREKLAAAQKKFDEAQKAQAKLQTDEGFQATLEIYNTMPPKQVKSIFMTMSDQTMLDYLKAMEPRTVSKITKEFKTPEETERVAKIMEKMRQSQASTKE